MPKVESIPVDAIRMDSNTQSRVRIDPAVVDAYAESIRSGEKLPPVDVYHDGTDYWPADGFHRTIATVNAGKDVIQARVHTGTRFDAMLHSAGANHSHGLQRTPEDKRNAVRMLLDEGHWSDRSIGWFASQCKVSHHLAKSVYEDWHEEREEKPPEKRVGKDGSVNTVKAPESRNPNTPPPEPSENPTREPEPPAVPTDAIGREVPERYRRQHRWNTDASAVIRKIGEIATEVRHLKGSPGGEMLNLSRVETDLKNAQTGVKFGKYHTECPNCLDVDPSPKCDVCKGAGWINKGVFDRLSDVQQKQLGVAPF